MKKTAAALLVLVFATAYLLPVFAQAETEYGYVPLGMDNYSRFLDIQQECYIPDDFPDPFRITYTLYVGLSTMGEPVGVSVSFEIFGTMRMQA